MQTQILAQKPIPRSLLTRVGLCGLSQPNSTTPRDRPFLSTNEETLPGSKEMPSETGENQGRKKSRKKVFSIRGRKKLKSRKKRSKKKAL